MEKIDLTKCNNCRFRAKVDGREIEGRIAVDGNYLRFFYGNRDIYSIHIPFYWEHGKVDYFDDFEIVPRDPETYKDMQVDHIFPKWRGGVDAPENLNPSCRMCNFYKGGGDIESFRKKMLTMLDYKRTFATRMALKYGILEERRWDGKFYFEKL